MNKSHFASRTANNWHDLKTAMRHPRALESDRPGFKSLLCYVLICLLTDLTSFCKLLCVVNLQNQAARHTSWGSYEN